MKNSGLPITPIVNKNGYPYYASNVVFDNNPLIFDLSKREHFVALAMKVTFHQTRLVKWN